MSRIYSEIYVSVVMRAPYKDTASLMLRAATYNFDLHRVLDDLWTLAQEMANRECPRPESHELFISGLREFQEDFATISPGIYKDLGFKEYFEKPDVAARLER